MCIFIMFLVGVSCVSAENIVDANDLSTDDSNAISVDEASDLSTDDLEDKLSVDDSSDDIGVEEENDVLTSSRSSTTVNDWTTLGNEVYNNNHDTIYLGANITPGSQISIRHDVTIIGSANTYIGGSSPSTSVSYTDIPIVTGANGLSVTFKNIKFQNCGGNTLMKLAGNGNFVLDNCTFENITAAGTKTVVFHLNYGTCDIVNCTFDNCLSDYGTVSNYKTDSEPSGVHMTVRDTTFKNNYATTEPGGINNCGYLTVYNSTFVNNSAAKWAGAIHTHYSGTTTIYNSNFVDNVAAWNGGALYAYNSLTVIGSNFTNNRAFNSNGGAIAASYYMTMPYVIIENCQFNNNSAVSSGGAISIGSGVLIVRNSDFNNNKANGSNGGAISATSTTLNVTDSNFVNNRANSNGGAIYNSKCKTNVIRCLFKNNTAVNGKGGAIYGTGKGNLNVDYCIFVNNTAADDNSGHGIAYSYTGSSATAAYLTYTNNEFYGPNNGTGSVYAANNKLNIVQYNNTISDYSNYTEPVDVVPIPNEVELGYVDWSVIFGDEDALSGTPVIVDGYILIPANHTLYCYELDGTYVWNVTAYPGCFCGLIVENGIIYAPCEGDKLYVIDLDTGVSLINASILEASSLYAPVWYNNTLYICSENGYGPNHNLWITMVRYIGGDYAYYNSILELNGVENYTQAMLSKPVIRGNYLYVNTIYGLIRYNLADNTMISITDTVGNFVMDNAGNICVLRNIAGSTYLYLLDSNLNIRSSVLLSGNCNQLVTDGNGNVYTIDSNGYINYLSYSGNSLSWGMTSFNINPVSAAMYCDEDYLYIGDDAGILWVFNTIDSSSSLKDSLEWAFNTNSTIVGGIIVEDDVVYVGNEDSAFYAIEYIIS